ncbi:MAG: YraN family protein [bacterium]|nr:YraN family protein [bacterium]
MDTMHNKELGDSGEDEAVQFLEQKGFEIVERNFRYQRSGEIDIIARKDSLLIFVEVKYRATPIFGGALYSVSSKKKRTLRFIANRFLEANPLLNTKHMIYRFDMIAFENNEIKWIEDIVR